MQANKNKKYTVADNESHLYHLLVTESLHVPGEQRYEKSERVVKMTKADFIQYDKHKKVCGFTAEEIIHDPELQKELDAEADELRSKEEAERIKAEEKAKAEAEKKAKEEAEKKAKADAEKK
jgi:colicin import membrane protein